MPSHRLEKDSMGKLDVLADALHGAQTRHAELNFQISERGIRRYVHTPRY